MIRTFLRTFRVPSVLALGLVTLSAFAIASDVQAAVRLRASIAPTCATTSSLKYADIFAEGNIAVMGSYNCRGAFIFNISNPDAPTLANWYNPGANQQFLEAIVVGNRGYFGSGNGKLEQVEEAVALGLLQHFGARHVLYRDGQPMDDTLRVDALDQGEAPLFVATLWFQRNRLHLD